jgi:hypothetical protein
MKRSWNGTKDSACAPADMNVFGGSTRSFRVTLSKVPRSALSSYSVHLWQRKGRSGELVKKPDRLASLGTPFKVRRYLFITTLSIPALSRRRPSIIPSPISCLLTCSFVYLPPPFFGVLSWSVRGMLDSSIMFIASAHNLWRPQ